MLRLKAMFRARGIKTPGRRVYHRKDREEWLAKLEDDGVRLRAQTLYATGPDHSAPRLSSFRNYPSVT